MNTSKPLQCHVNSKPKPVTHIVTKQKQHTQTQQSKSIKNNAVNDRIECWCINGYQHSYIMPLLYQYLDRVVRISTLLGWKHVKKFCVCGRRFVCLASKKKLSDFLWHNKGPQVTYRPYTPRLNICVSNQWIITAIINKIAHNTHINSSVMGVRLPNEWIWL